VAWFVVFAVSAVVRVRTVAPDPRFRRDAALAASLLVLALFDALFVVARRRLRRRSR
jgi:hypothetical protein